MKNNSENTNNNNNNRFTYFFSNLSPIMLKNKKNNNQMPVPIPIPIKTETGTIPAINMAALRATQHQVKPKLIRQNHYDEPYVHQSYKQRMEMIKRNLKQEKMALITKYANKMKQQQQQLKSKLEEKEKELKDKKQNEKHAILNDSNDNKAVSSTETKTTQVKLIDVKSIDAEKQQTILNFDDEMKNINRRTRKLSYRMSFTNLSTVKEENEFEESQMVKQQKYPAAAVPSLPPLPPSFKNTTDDLKKSNAHHFKPQQAAFIYDTKQNENKKTFELQSLNDVNKNFSKSNVMSQKTSVPNTAKSVVAPVSNTFTPIQNISTQLKIELNYKNGKNDSIERNNKNIQTFLNQEQQKQQIEIKQLKLNQIVNNNQIKIQQQQQQQQKLIKISPSSITNKPPPPIIVSNSNKNQKLTPNTTPPSTKTSKATSPEKTMSFYNSYLYTPSQNVTKSALSTFQSDFSKISEFGLIKIEENVNQSKTIDNLITHSTSDPVMFLRDIKTDATSNQVSKSPNNNFFSNSSSLNSTKTIKNESDDFYKNIYNYNINENNHDYNYDYLRYLNGSFESTGKINSTETQQKSNYSVGISKPNQNQTNNYYNGNYESNTKTNPSQTTQCTNNMIGLFEGSEKTNSTPNNQKSSYSEAIVKKNPNNQTNNNYTGNYDSNIKTIQNNGKLAGTMKTTQQTVDKNYSTNDSSNTKSTSNISVNIKYYNYDDYCNRFYKNTNDSTISNDLYTFTDQTNNLNENYYFKELFNKNAGNIEDNNKKTDDKKDVYSTIYSAVY